MKSVPIDLQHITLINFFLFIFAVVATITIANTVSVFIKNIMENKFSRSLVKWIAKIATYIVYAIGFYISFTKIIKFDLPAALAALGVFGAFCFVPTIPVLQNVISGIFIAFTRPFKEGELVDIGGEICEVMDMMILKTKLKATSGRIIFIPNISLITGNVLNYSRGKFLRIDLTFDFKNTTDFEIIENMLFDICKESQNVLPNIKTQKLNKIQQYFFEKAKISDYKPTCIIKSIGKDKFTINLWFWIADIKNRELIIHEVNQKVMEKTKELNIEFA